MQRSPRVAWQHDASCSRSGATASAELGGIDCMLDSARDATGGLQFFLPIRCYPPPTEDFPSRPNQPATMCKHVLNAQVTVRAPCCQRFFDVSRCAARTAPAEQDR